MYIHFLASLHGLKESAWNSQRRSSLRYCWHTRSVFHRARCVPFSQVRSTTTQNAIETIILVVNHNYDVSGYVSFKEENGSWFIRAFVHRVAKHAHNLHLREILDHVSFSLKKILPLADPFLQTGVKTEGCYNWHIGVNTGVTGQNISLPRQYPGLK